jgi:hypothetical protein
MLRAARRLGSSMMMRGQPVLAHQLQGQQGRFASAGGACRITLVWLSRAAKSSGNTGTMGREDKAMGTFCDTSEKGSILPQPPGHRKRPCRAGQEASGATRQDIPGAAAIEWPLSDAHHEDRHAACPNSSLPCPCQSLPRACDLARPAPLARPAGAREQPAPDPGLSREADETTQARLIAAAERQHCPFQRPSGSDRLVSARQSRLGGAR